MDRLRPVMICIFVLTLTAGCSDEASPQAAAPPSTSPIPQAAAEPFEVFSEQELRERIQSALGRARAGNKKVLLEFLASWCTDCREVVRVSTEAGPARQTLEDDYEVVYVEVGRFDRHQELIREYRVDRIATLVVLDGDGQRIAQSTLEPISNRQELSSQALADWLRAPRDDWSGGNVETPEPNFPAEIGED